jgi:hypothetical protein
MPVAHLLIEESTNAIGTIDGHDFFQARHSGLADARQPDRHGSADAQSCWRGQSASHAASMYSAVGISGCEPPPQEHSGKTNLFKDLLGVCNRRPPTRPTI